MADNSKIEWTDATWNPVTGCSIVSPGCTHCYAMKLAGTRLKHHPSRKGLTTMTKTGPVWNGEVRFNEGWLKQPIQWSRPRMIFVCAHGDLFHEGAPDRWLDDVFAVMTLAQRHTFQVLTKRSARMRDYLNNPNTPANIMQASHKLGVSAAGNDGPWGAISLNRPKHEWTIKWPLPNVWLGVSAERQKEADERIPDLLATPATVRFVSLEPLLGPIELLEADGYAFGALRVRLPKKTPDIHPPITKDSSLGHAIKSLGGSIELSDRGLDWVIVGGESGNGARPMHPEWARSLRDQCEAGGVPFFFKQWGAWGPALDADGAVRSEGHGSRGAILAGGHWEQFKRGDRHGDVFLLGKKRSGRSLDGVEHNGMPT